MVKPPTVATIDGKLMVSDGHQVWQIFADQFGSIIQRVAAEPFQGNGTRIKSSPYVSADGTIHWDGKKTTRSDMARSSSFAFDGMTLAVTVPNSFHVYLFAWTSLVVPPSQMRNEPCPKR